MANAGWVPLGYVARTHGVRGAMILHWHDAIGELPRFPESLALTLPDAKPKIYKVTSHRPHHAATLVTLQGIDDLDVAKNLRGAQVAVPEADLPALPPGEVYLYRLMHAACEDTQGVQLGTLSHIYSHGGTVVLGISDAAGEERLVPLLEHTLRSSRAPADGLPGTMVLDVPAELLQG